MKLQASDFYSFFETNEQKIINYLVGLINQTHFSYSGEVLTPFLTLREQFILNQLIKLSQTTCQVSFFGGYHSDHEESERKRALLTTEKRSNFNKDDFEITAFEIGYNNKFNELSHGKIYAALHQLGVEFHLFGDIINQGDVWQFFADQTIAEYVRREFNSIFKIKIKLLDVPLSQVIIPEQSYEEMSILTTSKRIDNLIASATNQSRSAVKQLVESSAVKRNWVPLAAKQLSHSIALNDYISVRHFGRFQFIGEQGETKRGKHRLVIKLWRNKKRG
ncbi:YlmH/Sll1252 family protein [Holzapfeliella sp. He02]|uniref:YlmH/Sll1252 family protein n=1 Tax=Holzapfeliella saturejae TaxID=3082953 RepID=A0ABU8SGF2_9LACO